MKRLTSFFYIFLMLFSLGHAQSWVDSSPMSCDELQGQIESDGTNLFYLTIERNTFELKLQTFDGSQWQAFGSPTFNSLQIVGEKPVLSMKGSTPYIFYADVSGKLNVIYYDGSSWQYLGGPAFHDPQTVLSRVSFDASGNQPYLSYIDLSDNYKVKVWTFDGSSWQNLPAAGQASISFTCIRTSGSTPYLAFLGRPPFNTLSFVKKYNGSAWVDVGLPLFATGSGSKCINFYNGEPYILLYDRANNALPTVKKFDGSNWGSSSVECSTQYLNGTPVANSYTAPPTSNTNNHDTHADNGYAEVDKQAEYIEEEGSYEYENEEGYTYEAEADMNYDGDNYDEESYGESSYDDIPFTIQVNNCGADGIYYLSDDTSRDCGCWNHEEGQGSIGISDGNWAYFNGSDCSMATMASPKFLGQSDTCDPTEVECIQFIGND